MIRLHSHCQASWRRAYLVYQLRQVPVEVLLVYKCPGGLRPAASALLVFFLRSEGFLRVELRDSKP